MNRALIAAALTLFAALPVSGASRSCNGALVTQGVCRSTSNVLLSYDAPPAKSAALRDAIGRAENYPATVPCESVRRFRPLYDPARASKMLAAAGVASGDCTDAQRLAGAQVANPQAAADFADALIESLLRNYVLADQHRAILRAHPPAEVADPDIGP